MVRLGILDIQSDARAQQKLWSRGGIPASFHARSDTESFRIRTALIGEYTDLLRSQPEQEISKDIFKRLLTMLARGQGSIFSAWRTADRLQLSLRELKSCLDELQAQSLLRILPPFEQRTGEPPIDFSKLYLRDSGLLHALYGIRDHAQLLSRPVAGKSWEGFVIENLLSQMPEGSRAGFFRSEAGAEMDLVLALPGSDGVWAIEIKHNVKTRLKRGFHSAVEQIQPDRCYVVHAGRERFQVMKEVEAIGLEAMARLITDAW